MAIIDQMEIPEELTPYTLKQIRGIGVSANLASPEKIKQLVSTFFWMWYNENKNDTFLRLSLFKGLVRTKVYVYQLESLFILLFGPKDGLSF